MEKLAQPPTFSLITVCYQAKEALDRTMESIAAQDCSCFEYLVIDGGSNDGTSDILANSTIPNLRWISEPDKGLYDAMNKGLAMARGQFVWFINAGDLLEGKQVLSHLQRQVTPETDILYGEVLMVDPQGRELGTRTEVTTQHTPLSLTWRDMRFGMVVSHQAFLPRRSICSPYISGNLCADIDWVIQCLMRSKLTTHTNRVLARFETGGLSRQRHRESLRDRYIVLQHHFGFWPNLMNHFWIIIRAITQRLSFNRKHRY